MGGVYLDACSIVYLIEAAQPFHGKVVAALKAFRQTAGPQVVTSRLSMLECRVLPVRDSDARPIHVVGGIPKNAASPAVIVTAYRPDPAR